MPTKSGKTWNSRRRRVGEHSTESRGSRQYFGHDDRTVEDVSMKSRRPIVGNRPRVSFKNQSNKERRYGLALAVKRVLDDDFPMSAGSNNNSREVVIQQLQRNRGRGPSRGRNSPSLHRVGSTNGHPERKRFSSNDTVWHAARNQTYKITIPSGQRYQKGLIMSKLQAAIHPETFIPIMYTANENCSFFYVDDQKTANKLRACDKVTMEDNFRLYIKVEVSFPPYSLDQTMKDKMKHAMIKRYTAETNALDLSQFHHDPELVDDYFCALSRPSILIAVLDIVAAAIPNLEALSLDNNKLQSFEKLSVMKKKLSCIKILYLGDNKIREFTQLNAIKELPLEELRLAGNPVSEKHKTRHDDYVSAIRAKFPKLLRLDGVELPRPIGFDIETDEAKLPPTQRMFVPHTKAQEIAGQFLQQYFTIFDSDNRQPLLDAYHEQAQFSLTTSQSYSNNKFSRYHADNRNLKRIIDPARRKKLLKIGRLPVVSYITEMPRTQHDLSSFTMDISLVMDSMMLITVAGLFKELDTKEEPLRYFSRTFIIVPEGSGYCIKNEQLHITYPTSLQEKQAFKPPPVQAPAAPTPSTSGTGEISDEIRQQMTLTLSQHTNMNLEWSLKCLKEVNWNFDVALTAFQKFFKLGQIPLEAFKK